MKQNSNVVALVLTLLCMAFPCIPDAYAQQQTYTLETSTFRLVFNRFTVAGDGYATGIRECRYLPTNTTLSMAEIWTTIANVDSGWDDPNWVSVVEFSQTVKEVTVHFGPSKSATMRVTSHSRFLEFELTDVTGNCGDIRLFGPAFLGLPQGVLPSTRGDYEPVTYLGNGYYACLIGANANTGTFRHWESPNDTSVLLQAYSPRYLPTAGLPHRTQRFAFFICREQDVKDIIREVELYFDYPFGSSLKENPENNIDYLFLLHLDGVSAQNIIHLCRETGLGAVMLYVGVWSDWWAQDEPFKLWPGIKPLIDSLRAAGFIVGLHSYVHLVPHSGYYATRYPTQVSQTIIDGIFRSPTWTNTLPDSIAIHFAAKVDTLNADWLYFDANGPLLEINGQHVDYLDPYLDARMTTRIMQELRQRDHDLKIFQSAGGTLCYSYFSRMGQVDYWDIHPITGRTPIQEMNFIASQALHKRRAFLYSDLGWFGREIHAPPPQWRRDARWDEWQHLCNVSLNYNIPIGIRTTYNDFMTDPLRDSIVVLLRETIRQRRGLVGVPVSVMAGWNMISNPVTVIGDSVRQLFPSSLFPYAFAYESSGRYAPSYRLMNGLAYWVKFPSPETNILNGSQRLVDSISVRPGWNMVGSISEPVAAAHITSIPPGTVTSQFFGFEAAGYTQFDTIQPGKGYWVKVTTDAMLVLTYQQADTASRIRIVPISELPPDTPGVTGVSLDELRPLRFVLKQNYPNPFNPQTSIHFELPEDRHVRLVVYDLLGRQVVTLVNEFKKAGKYDVVFNAKNLASGVYFYLLQAGTFHDVKKMLSLW
jgi:hypothetical protein